ncbi:DUF11 domain-containing protein [Streptomyces sp. TRM66268-LWL]|uniref:DUF11 domain-containing protein n=1 Tax=Streptomyces polyasparticus TaxID=2767826 RepID=A0ABR7SM71_9ACTN|nr:DUF11 domain-containing protein [Streptomyces polyasparticus]MBC9715795.1 DUF11 domain-containing protein [Streptomyces polyasparticus]
MGMDSRRVRRLLVCGLLSLAAGVVTAVPAVATGSDHDHNEPVGDPHAHHGAGPTVKVRPHGKQGSDVYSVKVRALGTERRTPAADGSERVTYEVVVRNRTGQDFPGTEIVQMLPGGAKVVSSEPEGFVDQEWQVWQMGLDAKETATLRSTVLVPPSDDADAPRSRSAVCVRVETAAGFSGCGADARPAKKHPAGAHAAPGAPGKPAAGGGTSDHDSKPAADTATASEATAASSEPATYKGMLIGSAVVAAVACLLTARIVRKRRGRTADR